MDSGVHPTQCETRASRFGLLNLLAQGRARAAGSRTAAGRAEPELLVSRYSFQTSFISSVDSTDTTRLPRKFCTRAAALLHGRVPGADGDGWTGRVLDMGLLVVVGYEQYDAFGK